MIAMKNTDFQRNPTCAYFFKTLLLIFSVIAIDIALAEKTIDPMLLEVDLRHWLSLYQSPETIKASKEITCLAQNIYFEARSESEQGQLAVGFVVMNRVAHKHYPNSICGVVKQGGEKRRYRCQFTWWCDGRSDTPINEKAWQRSLELARVIYRGHAEDPTDGALWYHADYVSPQWSASLVSGKKIGQHLFYLSKKQSEYAFNATSTLESAPGPLINGDELIMFPHFKVAPSYSGMGTSTSFPVLQL
jgi:hypothetical protein